MSHPTSRSSTPSRLYSPSRLGSSSRTHLPQPKVLPFPDLPVRQATSSAETSRGPSPLGSPRISPPFASLEAMASTSSFPFHTPSSSSSTTGADTLVSPLPLPPPGARLAHSASPTHPSPLGLETPRPTRPRAATSSVAVTAVHRQEGFQPASRPATPTPQVMPVNALAGVSTVSLAAGSPPNNARTSTTTATYDRPPATTPATAPAAVVAKPTSVKKPSNPPGLLPPTVPVSPPPPTGALVEHLHRSLKTGACADVRIWVRKWGVGWLVHKMVLVQTGTRGAPRLPQLLPSVAG